MPRKKDGEAAPPRRPLRFFGAVDVGGGGVGSGGDGEMGGMPPWTDCRDSIKDKYVIAVRAS